MFSTNVLAHSLIKLIQKLFATVSHYRCGKAMQLEDIITVQLGCLLCNNVGVACQEVSHLAETINYNKYEIISSICHRQGTQEVHADMFPDVAGYLQW